MEIYPFIFLGQHNNQALSIKKYHYETTKRIHMHPMHIVFTAKL